MTSLDQWSQPPQTQMKKGLSMTDEQIDKLYEESYERMIEKRYDAQIAAYLADEKAEKEAHKQYVESNYIRVGGN